MNAASLFLLAFFIPLCQREVLATISTAFINYLSQKYSASIVRQITRSNDIGPGGSFGGGAHVAGQQTARRPVVIINGWATICSQYDPARQYLLAQGYTDEEIYCSTVGSGQGEGRAMLDAMSCSSVKKLNILISSVAAFTNSTVDILAYSMGSPMARKALKAGQCVEDSTASGNLGTPLTNLVNTFIDVAGINNGAVRCEAFAAFAPCNKKIRGFGIGMECNSTFLNDINSAQRYEASNKIYTIYSQADDQAGYYSCKPSFLSSHIVGQNAGFEFQQYTHSVTDPFGAGTVFLETLNLQYELLQPSLNPAGIITTTQAPTTTASSCPAQINCEYGWTPFNGYCYKIDVINSGVGLNFDEANSACQDFGDAQLASVHSDAEAQFIATLVAQKVTEYPDTNIYCWLGLRLNWDDSTNTVTSFSWSDVSAADYPAMTHGQYPWDPLNPSNNGGNEDCVYVSSRTYPGLWNDFDCSTGIVNDNGQYAYGAPICKKRPPADCGEGWQKFNGNCYLLDANSGGVGANWDSAKSICENTHSSRLASIHSKEENDFIKAYIASVYQQNQQKVWYWFGMNLVWDDATNTITNATYDDGTAVDFGNPTAPGFVIGNDPWQTTDPNNGGGAEDCVGIWSYDSTLIVQGLWNDFTCSIRTSTYQGLAYGGALCKKSAP